MPCQRGKEGCYCNCIIHVFVSSTVVFVDYRNRDTSPKERRGGGTDRITHLFVFVLAHAKEGFVVLGILVRIFLVVRPSLLQKQYPVQKNAQK